ncbi:MAG TPA: DoxX family protein [Parafilimonas sp.]|nr:DoxX family protein [Parafilimonas sp.]
MEATLHYPAKKSDKIIFRIFTIIIFLVEAVMPALTFNSDLAKQGIAHLGYPDYFRIELTIFKVLGGLALIIPSVPARVKEWAYFGFVIDFVSAFIGHVAVDGFNGQAMFPLVMLVFLIISYVYYHKIKIKKVFN